MRRFFASLASIALLLMAPTFAAADPPSNDDFDDAQDISTSEGVVSFRDATMQPDEPNWCGISSGSVWFRYTPSIDGRFAVRTVPTSASTPTHYISVFTGDELADLDLLTCDSKGQIESGTATGFIGEVGVTYAIQIIASNRSNASVRVGVHPNISGDVVGTVTDTAGEPIPGACVQVNGVTTPLTSASDGAYRLTTDPGAHTGIIARMCGPQTYAWTTVQETFVVGPAFETRFDFILTKYGSISGTLSGPDGEPVESMCALGWPDGGALGDVSSWSQQDGTYTFQQLFPGRYRLKFANCFTETGYAGEWYDDQGGFATATVLEISEGQELTGIDAVLARDP